MLRTLLIATCPFLALCGYNRVGAAKYATPESDKDLTIPSVSAYDAAVENLDVRAVMKDLEELMTNSQDWWPADYGHYGPFFIRLAWHCSGTYRDSDGRGGCGGGRQRFEPERSWPDNTNLDKARALVWPIKQKHGDALSWGDLFTLAGTTAIGSMGGPVYKVCTGRIDAQDGTESLDFGPTKEQEKVAPCEINGLCDAPLGASTVGLIYVNPEGPVAKGSDGQYAPDPDPAKSAKNIREVFARMGFSVRETMALIGGGHAFGKTHGACPDGAGDAPNWPGNCGSGSGKDTFTSGFEGAWTLNPTKFDNTFFKDLLRLKWEKHKGPGGHWQWRVQESINEKDNVALSKLMRLTSDIALLHDDEFKKIVTEYATDHQTFSDDFAKAWFKLTTDGGRWSRKGTCIQGSKIEYSRLTMRNDDLSESTQQDSISELSPSAAVFGLGAAAGVLGAVMTLVVARRLHRSGSKVEEEEAESLIIAQ